MSRIYYTKPSITELEIRYATDAAANGWGERCYDYITRFEDVFRRHLGIKYAIATSSCTGVLHMGLAALGVGPGDEVIMADTNWIATAAPIVHLGAKPVFVDILPDSWCIDPELTETAITPRTKAIIAVHLYGNLCDMDRLLDIGQKHRIPIIEDAAEAIGSQYHGKRAGSMGKFGAFSFHGTKTLTTGEGGMFVTNDAALYETVLTLSNHSSWQATPLEYAVPDAQRVMLNQSDSQIRKPMSAYEQFKSECDKEISVQGADKELSAAGLRWANLANRKKYSYHFEWLDRPIIQLPQDMVAMQELIWQIKPDLIIETGIAHGGSLILSASMLAMIDYCEAAEAGKTLDPRAGRRRVLGLDIDIRAHNRTAIEAHPLAHKIDMIQGSSIASDIIAQVHEHAKDYERILVCLDSNHTHEHVLAELEAYAPLVSPDSYCVVFDTIIEDMPDDMFPDRPWGKGNNPKTAVWEYLKSHPDFEIDKNFQNKLLITVAPDGYLRRVR